jgi:hypothetical protein
MHWRPVTEFALVALFVESPRAGCPSAHPLTRAGLKAEHELAKSKAARQDLERNISRFLESSMALDPEGMSIRNHRNAATRRFSMPVFCFFLVGQHINSKQGSPRVTS